MSLLWKTKLDPDNRFEKTKTISTASMYLTQGTSHELTKLSYRREQIGAGAAQGAKSLWGNGYPTSQCSCEAWLALFQVSSQPKRMGGQR